MNRFAFCTAVLAVLVLPILGMAGEKGHGSMPGMKDGGSMEGHGKMGDKIFTGKIGPWNGEARLIDMKASIEKAKASGIKMVGTMKSHHFELFLSDPKTRKEVTEGKVTVAVVGPDKKEAKSDIAAMAGHFGVDVDLAKPGKYTFKVSVESGGKKGSATFSHTLK